VLIHQYEVVRVDAVWLVIERDLPALEAAITAVLPPLDELERQLAGAGDPEDR
jgi:uncharacterized protein with HEPN domain